MNIFSIIQKLEHIVRTVVGGSELSFGGEEWIYIEALMGAGQGNGAGLEIWAVFNSFFMF